MKNKHIYPNDYRAVSSSAGLPASENSFGINLYALFIGIFFLVFIKYMRLNLDSITITLSFVGIITISVWLLEYLTQGSQSIIAQLKIRRKLSWKRLGFKLLGIGTIFSVLVIGYWLFPVYKDGLYIPYFQMLKRYALPLLILTFIYFCFMDKVEEEPQNAYWQLGRLLLGKKQDADKEELIELFRGWGVKFFYLAIMLPFANTRLDWFMHAEFKNIFRMPYDVFYFFNELIFFIDLGFATAGYIMTFKLFNTHIRSSEPTFLGWFVALSCYWPFWDNLISPYYLSYNTGIYWSNLFTSGSFMFYFWTVLILLCELIYCLGTIALGLRFSNLTYRGLITNGPYAYTKHPAYVFKNISWWLISLPFMVAAQNPLLAIKGSLLLLGVNFIYYLRAKTEENHLSHYPEYVEYALAMNKKSIFAPVAKIFPFLKYKAPTENQITIEELCKKEKQ